MVIDPGHGGEDTGLSIANNLVEKELTLTVALKLKPLLASDSQVQVLLTRGEDLNPSITDRTVFANRLKAGLFLSIHLIEQRSPNQSEVFVYQYSPLEVSKREAKTSASLDRRLVSWKEGQLRHLKKSLLLAQEVHASFYPPWQRGAQPIIGLPLAILAGIDMPAIVVEISAISKDQTESSINVEVWLNHIAENIFNGIKQYLMKMGTGSP